MRSNRIAIVVPLVVVVLVAGFLLTSCEPAQQRGGSLDMVDWETIRESPRYDLAEINLLNHDLTGSELFIARTLTDVQTGATFNVSVIAVGQIEQEEPRRVIWRWVNENGLEAMGMSYSLWPSPNILDPLHVFIEHDIHQYNSRGFALSTTVPLRINDELSAAFFVLNIQRPENPYAITIIYLSHTIPDSDYTVISRLVLPSLVGWSEEATAIIDELSYHIGIDLAAYLP